MINNDLDLAPIRATLQRMGRVQVRDYLQDDAALTLERCLMEEVPWNLGIREHDEVTTLRADELAAMDEESHEALLRRVQKEARGKYAFAYENYMMIQAYKRGYDPGLLLHRLLEFLNSPPHLEFLHALTGDTRIRRVNAQATRYRRGHFLRYHTDINSSEGRLYAYVLNLSHDWHADWGGLLQFIDGDGRVVDSFLPRWNTLSLFAVPAGHAVSLVAPWAGQDRLAITGWLLL